MSENQEKRKRGNPNWEKGKSGNPHGRPAGSKNKSTHEIREFIRQAISGEMDNLSMDLNELSPFQRWLIIDKMARYFMPQLNKSEVEQKQSSPIKIEITYEDKLIDKNEEKE